MMSSTITEDELKTILAKDNFVALILKVPSGSTFIWWNTTVNPYEVADALMSGSSIVLSKTGKKIPFKQLRG